MDDPFAGEITQAPRPPISATSGGGDDPFAGEIVSNQAAPSATVDRPQLGWSNIGESTMQGIRRGIGDIGETFGAQGPEQQSPAAAPFEWSWPPDPASLINKGMYRLGAGSPTVAAGIAGGVGGEAIAGPAGGIAGGALGAAAGSALQTLGPVYHQQLRKTPDDPKGAWDRAVDEAMLSGAFSGAAWAAFPVRFFKGPLFNAATQIGVVQPGLSMGHQAASNVIEGKPATENLGEAYTEGAVGTAMPMLGHAAISRIGRAMGTGPQAAQSVAQKAAAGEPVSADDLKGVSQQHYDALKNLGAQYPHKWELESIRDEINNTLWNAGVDRRFQPDVFRIVDEIPNPRDAARNPIVEFTDIEHVRKVLTGMRMGKDPEIRRAASIAIDKIDDWIGNPQRQIAAGVDQAVAPLLSESAENARSYWRAYKGAQEWEHLQDQIENARNPDSKKRTLIEGILRSPSKLAQFPEGTKELMEAAVRNKLWEGLAKTTSIFDPKSPFGLFANYFAHSAAGPVGLVGMPLAILSRWKAGQPMRKMESRVPAMIRAAPTGGLPPSPTLGQRTGQAYNPYAGPVTPQSQQQARGGKVKKALRLARRQDGGDVDAPSPQTGGEDGDAEAARTVAAQRTRQAVQPSGGRQEGAATAWTVNQGEQIADAMKGLAMHPENLVGPGELGGMFFPIPREAASRASEALQKGILGERDIWNRLGIFRDVAGDWRKEILGPSKLTFDPRDVQPGRPMTTTLGKAVDQPHVYDEMPQLHDMPFSSSIARISEPTAQGLYYPYRTIQGEGFSMRQSDPSIWLRSTGRNPLMTAQHETQHAVDQPAGFLRNIGGDPDWFANRNPNDPLWQFYQNELRKPGIDPKYYWDQMAAREATEFQRYRRSIHEVMARNAEKREALYNLTHDMGGPEMAQRSLRKMMPQETEEVPRAMQLIGKQIPYRKGGRAKRALAMVKRAA